jgi:hypothetical protein
VHRALSTLFVHIHGPKDPAEGGWVRFEDAWINFEVVSVCDEGVMVSIEVVTAFVLVLAFSAGLFREWLWSGRKLVL